MTINFYLDSKTNTLGEKAIYCFIRGIAKKKTIYINTGVKIDPDFWNDNNKSVRKTHNNYSGINLLLEKIKFEILRLYTNHSTKTNFSFENFKREVNHILQAKTENEKSKTFFDYFDLFIDSRKNALSSNTLDRYRVICKHLRNFEKNKKYPITFDSINLDFYDKLYSYFINDLNHIDNTIHKSIKILKTFLNWATERNYNTNTAYKKFKTKEYKTEIVYLTEQELKKLFYLDLNDKKRLANMRDVFCFACFTGQRFSDVSKLKSEHISNGTWYLRTQKTKDIIEIPLNNMPLKL